MRKRCRNVTHAGPWRGKQRRHHAHTQGRRREPKLFLYTSGAGEAHLTRVCRQIANDFGAGVPKQPAKYNASGGERHAFRDQVPEESGLWQL